MRTTTWGGRLQRAPLGRGALGRRAASECVKENPLKRQHGVRAIAQALPGYLQGTKAPRWGPRTQVSAPGSQSHTDRSQEGTQPGGSAQPGSGGYQTSLDNGFQAEGTGAAGTVGTRDRREVSTETPGSSLDPGHSQQDHSGSHRSPSSPALGIPPFHFGRSACGKILVSLSWFTCASPIANQAAALTASGESSAGCVSPPSNLLVVFSICSALASGEPVGSCPGL